jgi:hypothetical protein
VGHGEDIIEIVTDHDDTHTLCSDALDQAKSSLSLCDAKRGCRLIKHYKPVRSDSSTGKGNSLSLASGQTPNRHGQVRQADSEFINAFSCYRKRALCIQKFERPQLESNGLLTKHDVCCGVKIVTEREMLIYGFDSKLPRTRWADVLYFHLSKPDRTFVRLLDAAQDFNQGAFARPVLANQSEHLPRENVERDLI